jgi:class 3 adenylate cyclase
MAIDIAQWLRGLGLAQYEEAFRKNAIDARVLRELTVDGLKEVGVSAVDHRRLLLNAIAALRTDDGAAVKSAPSLLTRSAEAERRVLTVMFCDLVGSTLMSARLDPEDLREVIAAYHRAVAATVARFGGVVAKYMGDARELLDASLGNQAPKAALAAMLSFQPGGIRLVRLEDGEVLDHGCEACALHEMPRGMAVAARPGLGEREVDHRPKHERRGERVLAGERIGGRRQDLVMIAIELRRPLSHKASGSIQCGPGDQER